MNVPELLEAAVLLVPEEIATENDITVREVWENLANVAEQIRLKRGAARCHWRSHETLHGVIRADLTLRPASEARRQIPFDGAGALRPMWNIGHRTRSGEPGLDIAALWAESTPSVESGGRCPIRLAPLDPSPGERQERTRTSPRRAACADRTRAHRGTAGDSLRGGNLRVRRGGHRRGWSYCRLV
ncbi:hypothetical protein [Streptomyces sp. SUK 48]|uniref:hypothetical protein n=1 Tax=Streptomyces sp. SUK 48 TaxID=2582831 RepID=UPI001891190D|nr:hypothetical protein [Streptomyces sp. SUK 48]